MHANTTAGLLLRHRTTTNGMESVQRVPSVHSSELKTQGEIEAQVSDVLRRYSLEYFGRGPQDVHAHLIGDLVLVRMSGVLTAAEQHLAATTAVHGELLVKQVRSQMVELARKELDAAIRSCTLVNVISLHHDISTVTGEEIMVFTLDGIPATRPTKRK